MLNKGLLKAKNLQNRGKDLNENSGILIDEKLDAFFTRGKDAIEKFFDRKCERYKKLIQMEKYINTKRLQEDFLIRENRGIENIKFKKERKIAKFEEALELRALNKVLKLKNDEELMSGGILSLNEDSDAELDIIYENGAKNARK